MCVFYTTLIKIIYNNNKYIYNNIYIIDNNNNNMVKKFIGNNVDVESYDSLKDILRKERIGIGNWLQNQIDEYIKVHSDGNPAFTLDQFSDPNFVACPAFYRDHLAWNMYLKKVDDKELEKIKQQVIMIDKTLGLYL